MIAVLATSMIAEARVFTGSSSAEAGPTRGWALYGCTADGYLRVTIGSETLDVPVDCTTGG